MPLRPSEADIKLLATARVPKVAIITGANSGIGYVGAEYFAEGGWHVILACRDAAKGPQAADALRAKYRGSQVTFMHLDVSSLASVRSFAKQFAALKLPLHLLAANAGMAPPAVRTLTDEGVELALATNHLGHFALTDLLLPILKDTAAKDRDADVRVVVTASELHTRGVINANMENLQGEVDYPGRRPTYQKTKLANVLFARELERRLQGTGVHAFSFTPGFVPATNLFRNFGPLGGWAFYLLMSVVAAPRGFLRTLREGGQCLVWTATAPQLRTEGGQYVADCRVTASSAASNDAALAKSLWEYSEALVKKCTPRDA